MVASPFVSRAGLVLVAGVLAACTQTAAPPVPQAPAGAVLVTPSNFRLPEGTGCSGDIARFRAIQANDLETGHVNRKVYDQIAGELNEAERLCASGNSAGASAAVRAIKARHGYPV